jgi:DNA polymerase-3 subunit epsilon
MQRVENGCRIRDTADMEYSLEQMARSLVESGEYRVTSRLEPQAEYYPPDNSPKLVAAVVDVETTGTNPDRDKIIELGICLFEYDRQNGRIYRVLGSWEWLEDPGFSIPSEITGITDEIVAGHRIDDRAVNDLLGRVVVVIAHNADFDRRFLEKRIPGFATKHWACSRFDIDWKAEGIRSSALEFVAYSLGFFHDGHRVASDCRATLHALAQPLPGTGRLALQALLEQARLPTWRLWARDAAIEKKDALKARGYTWSPGEFGRTEMLVSRHGRRRKGGRGVVAPRKRDRVGSSCMGVAHHGERSVFGSMLGLGSASGYRNESVADHAGRRWSGVMTPDVVWEGQNDTLV